MKPRVIFSKQGFFNRLLGHGIHFAEIRGSPLARRDSVGAGSREQAKRDET